MLGLLIDSEGIPFAYELFPGNTAEVHTLLKVVNKFRKQYKIKDVIGKGGKVIQDICATCNCKIDVQEDGHVFVSAVDQEDAKRAIFTIKTIVEDPEIGAIYKGRVTRLMNFGAFVELAPGKDGMVHISKLADHRVEKVEDVVNIGDMIWVKVTEIDEKGRVNLSRKDALIEIEAQQAAAKAAEQQ